MTEAASRFVGSIPQIYDTGLGPVIFEGYAADMAERAARAGAGAVLELAAGTGIVSRKLRDRLSPGARLVATDLNPPMLELAARKFRPDEAVEFRPADAMQLPFGDASFDLVVCQFGVMFFPDKRASFREVWRALRAGGRYLLNVWGPMAANPFAQIAFDVGARVMPDNPPVFYRVPFSYADPSVVQSDLASAGFEDVRFEVVRLSKPVEDWTPFAHALVHGNPFIEEIGRRPEISPETVVAAVEDALRERLGPAPALMPLEAIVFEARKP